MSQKWIKKYVLITIFILSLIGLINYIMDPFWTFNHSHKFNNFQKDINERQQKSNYIYFTDKKYDTLLLGSSRTTYMNPNSFENYKVFNYSAVAMRPQEYKVFIDFAIKDSNQPIDTIILAVDFFGYLDNKLFKYNQGPKIIENTKSLFYRWKNLFTFDALEASLKNLKDYFKNKADRYTRELIKSYSKRDPKSIENQVLIDIEDYKKEAYNGNVNINFYTILNNLKNDYNDKKFLIYTTPISYPLFKEMLELGHKDNYKNWLRDLVEIFGEIHHFMYINSVTVNYTSYFGDSNHAYPETNAIVAKTVEKNENLIYDFGIILNKNNIEEFLSKI